MLISPATGSSEGSALRLLGVDSDEVAGGVGSGGGELIGKSCKSKDLTSLFQPAILFTFSQRFSKIATPLTPMIKTI